MGWPTIILTMAALAVFEGVVSRTSSASSVGGVIAKAGDALHWWLSPAVPFFSVTATAELTPAVSGATTAPAGATLA